MLHFQTLQNWPNRIIRIRNLELKIIILIVLQTSFLTLTTVCQTINLTGYWQTEVGGCFQIRHYGNQIVWSGSPSNSTISNNVFQGAIADNILTGLWYDLPSNPYQGFASSLSLRIETNNRMVKNAESNPYNGKIWTRINGNCSNDNLTPQYPPSSSGGILVGEWDMECCDKAFVWICYITKHDGNTFSGTFSSNASSSTITGKLNGNFIEFDRIGGAKQHYTGQLVNNGGVLQMINGLWTGEYLERYLPPKNNWKAVKRR